MNIFVYLYKGAILASIIINYNVTEAQSIAFLQGYLAVAGNVSPFTDYLIILNSDCTLI